jgi:hypothetical protein
MGDNQTSLFVSSGNVNNDTSIASLSPEQSGRLPGPGLIIRYMAVKQSVLFKLIFSEKKLFYAGNRYCLAGMIFLNRS